MLTLTLPFPPSTNNLYLNVRRGRVKSPDYRSWIEEAGHALNRQAGGVTFTERVSVSIAIDDKRQGDVSNRIKAVEDLLVSHGVLQGDSKKYVLRVSAEWARVDGCTVQIEEVANG